jgi:dolichyl-diphosphooligosaccharide--protein glycosyltransferase/undecaprenyl-diphosphooligosaccharide--protein glycosyltransferase
MAAISAVYLFHVIASYAQDRRIYYLVLASLTAIMIYPNITHIIGYKVPTVMSKQEVMVLDKLKANSSSKDYVVTWWDYGYPIWYYADKNTLIDGGKHNNDNFIVSEILLTSSPLEAARLSRLAVEGYVSSGYKLITDTLFKNNTPEQVNVNDYLDELRYSDDVAMPPKTRDVYLYLPWRMMRILPTVKLFSNLDLNTGKALSQPFFYSTQYFKQEKDVILLGQNLALLTKENKLQIGNRRVDIGKYITVGYTKEGKVKVDQTTLNPSGKFSIIYMSSYRTFLVMDDSYFNSLFIQMFVLEKYDRDLFEPVILDPMTKIYKLKI